MVGSAVQKRLPSRPQVLPNSSVALRFRKKSDHLPMDRLREGMWLQPPVFTYTCCFRHAPIAAGLKGVCRQIGDRWRVPNWPVHGFIVRRPVHRGNPSFSAWEVLILRHEEPLQWMTKTSLGATSCSRRSNDTCCHRLHNRWLLRWTFLLVPPRVRLRIQ